MNARLPWEVQSNSKEQRLLVQEFESRMVHQGLLELVSLRKVFT